MNWKELKDFCNVLPEGELSKAVILWREDEAITDISAMTLDEDHYRNPEEPENGCFAESDARSIVRDSPEDFPAGMDDLEKVYDKGHPLLMENF